MTCTNITAIPRPIAVDTFLETAKNEHIPKKYAKIMLSMKTDFKNILIYSNIAIIFSRLISC